MGPPCISIKLVWSSGEQLNHEHKQVITDERNKIIRTILINVGQIKSKYGFSGIPKFKKYSKTTAKYVSCELQNLNDGDYIYVEFAKKAESRLTSELIQKPVKDPKNKMDILKEKLIHNQHLSGDDRLFLYKFLSRHGEHCLGQQQECEAETSKKRKLDSTNDEENKTVKQIQTSSIDHVERHVQIPSDSNFDVGIQCDLPIYTDYKKIETMLSEMYKSNESWTEEDRMTFITSFRNTFGSRRHFIVSDDPPTAAVIKDLYPYLFHKDQVFLEFELIADRTGMLESFRKNVEIYSHILMERTDCKLKRKIELYKSSDLVDPKCVDMAGSLLLLPFFMEEERKGIILFKDEILHTEHDARPFIRSSGDVLSCLEENGKFRVYIDNVKLCTTSNLIDAYFALMASYYIFNASYPHYTFGTFACLERLYVEHIDEHSGLSEKHIEDKIKFLVKNS